jgi:hypothetical protein
MPTSASRHALSRDCKLAARGHSQVQSGNISRAANSLDSLPLVEVTPHVMQEIHNLHPYSASPSHIAVEAPPLTLTEEVYAAVVENLGVSKAPWLTGWSHEEIKQLSSRRAGKQAKLMLMNALLAGQLPLVFELLDCDGLPQASGRHSPHCHRRGVDSAILPSRAQVQCPGTQPCTPATRGGNPTGPQASDMLCTLPLSPTPKRCSCRLIAATGSAPYPARQYSKPWLPVRPTSCDFIDGSTGDPLTSSSGATHAIQTPSVQTRG